MACEYGPMAAGGIKVTTLAVLFLAFQRLFVGGLTGFMALLFQEDG